MNLDTLQTLDARQYYSGFAEIMKHGLIKDAKYYEWLISNMYEICERDPETLLSMIKRSCEIKKEVVENDPTEQGERALLNFGHTIGHAIEKNSGFQMLHGECVALGCVAAAYISWKKSSSRWKNTTRSATCSFPSTFRFLQMTWMLQNRSTDQVR